jgi:RecB family endonuclease NucS
VRLVVARCEVTYTGRLTAYLPEATRLLVFKADGSVLVHADSGGDKPLNSGTTTSMVCALRLDRLPERVPRALRLRRLT